MAIKRTTAPTPTPAPAPAAARKPLKSTHRQVAPPAEEADPADSDPDPEPTSPRKRAAAAASGGTKSFAALFDAAKPTGGFMPVGTHKVYIIGFELEGEIAEEGEDQGKLKAKVTYEGHEDSEEGVAGKTLSQWYSLSDDDGEAMGGCGFIKKDLDILGYEEVTLTDLEEIFEMVVNERPLVIINVKQNGQYTNAYLQGLAEGE